jgi:Tol biopolymer transport system component
MLADHSGLVFAATEPESDSEQIWLLPYPQGQPRRITNDPNSYSSLSLSADSSTLIATQSQTLSSLWVAPQGKTALDHRIISNDRDNVGVDGLAWTPDGNIIFTSYRGGNLDLWITGPDGSNTRQLTRDQGSNFDPSVSPDGRTIAFISTRGGTETIWKADSDGGNPVQLTHGGIEFFPRFTPDGKDVMYESYVHPGVFKISLAGGDPVQIFPDPAFQGLISPDGKLLAAVRVRDNPLSDYIDVHPLAGGPSVAQIDLPVRGTNGRVFSWAPDSKGLIFLDSRDGVSNLWLQLLAGGKRRQVTDFTADNIYNYDWSMDGKQLVVARGNATRDLVLISYFR